MASFALGGVPGMGSRAAEYALREAAREEPGVIQGALTTLGRAGYAVRDLIAGDYEGAAGQAAVLGSQILSAPFTGGVSLIYPDVSALGLASYFGAPTSAAELAPVESQREFSDLLSPETLESLDATEGWRRVAIDVLGGVITDPLSLLSGGSGAVGSAGKGLITGSLRGSAPHVLRALKATKSGRVLAEEALNVARATVQATGTKMPVEQIAALNVMEDAFRRASGGIAGPVQQLFSPTADAAERLTLATRQLMREGSMAPFTVRLGPTFNWSAEFGIPSSMTSGLPGKLAGEFVHDLVNPFNRKFLASMIGGAALGPGGTLLARGAMKIPAVDNMITNTVAAVSRKLVDKFSDPRIPMALRQELRQMFGQAKSETAELERRASSIFGGPEFGNDVGWTPEQMEALTEHFEWINSRIHRHRSHATAAQNWIDKMSAGQAFPDLDTALANHIQTAAQAARAGVRAPLAEKWIRAIDALAMPSESDLRALLKAHAYADPRLSNLVPSVPGARNRIDEAIDLHLDTMQRIQRERIGLGIQGQLPRHLLPGDTVQLTDEIKALGKTGAPTYNVVSRRPNSTFVLEDRRSGQRLVRQLNAVTKKAKGSVRPGDYRLIGTLARPLQQAGMRVDELFYTTREFQPWVEKLLGEQANVKANPFRFRRYTRTRSEYEAAAEAKLRSLYPQGSKEYRQVEDLINTLGKQHGLSIRSLPVLTLDRAARHFTDVARHRANTLADAIPQFRDVITEATKDVRSEVVNKAGKIPVVLRGLSQVNRRWKGLLTSVNPAFHFRNWLGTLYQTLQTENLPARQGLALWVGTGAALPRAFSRWVTRFMGRDPGLAGSEMQKYIDAVYGNTKAWSDLAGKMLPGTDIPVQSALQAAAGRLLKQNQVTREVIDDLMGDHMAKLLKAGKLATDEHANAIYRTIDTFVERGADVANFVEDRMRLGTFLQILTNEGRAAKKAGVSLSGSIRDLTERAIQDVNRAFVNYDVQSVADYWMRQLIPFARFPIATVGPALRAMRDRPLYRALPRAIMAEGERQGQVQPEQVRRGFEIPLGGGFSTRGLGSPLQAVDEITRALPGPRGDVIEGARRGALAQIQPGIGAAVGALTDTNLYFGGPFWRQRTIEGPVADALERMGAAKRGADGTRRVSPQVQAMLDSQPFSRLTRDVLSLAAGFEKGEAGKSLLTFMTGLQEKHSLSSRELEALAETYFQRRVRQGDLNVYRRFYQQGTVDPELQALIKAADASRAARTKKKKGE